MPSAGFKPTIPATKRPQTYALDHMATKFDLRFRHRNNLDIKTQLRVEISVCPIFQLLQYILNSGFMLSSSDIQLFQETRKSSW
jgi:hypothetical protein